MLPTPNLSFLIQKSPCTCRLKDFIMGVQKYFPKCWKLALNDNLPLFPSPKNQPLCVPRPPKPDPLPVLGITNMTGFWILSPIASLLEWQWHRIVMRNGQFYQPSRNGASWTAQCREITEPFYQVMHACVGEPRPHPFLNFSLKFTSTTNP